MNFIIYSGLVIVLLMSVLFLGPGLFSERTDYPIITWFKRRFGGAKQPPTPKPPSTPPAGPDRDAAP